jgi:hypothetical protein
MDKPGELVGRQGGIAAGEDSHVRQVIEKARQPLQARLEESSELFGEPGEAARIPCNHANQADIPRALHERDDRSRDQEQHLGDLALRFDTGRARSS